MNSDVVLAQWMSVPAPLLLLLALIVAVGLAAGGQWLVHRRFPGSDFVRHNEVGGFIISVVGTLYAVVVGFLIAIAWQHFADARQLVATECAAATDAWHVAVGLPAPERSRTRRDVLAYATYMVAYEWPKMRVGSFDIRGDLAVMDAMGTTGSFMPHTLGEANAQNAVLQQMGILHDARQRRLAENRSAVSPFEWFILLLGGVAVTCFCWLFGMLNERVHLLMTSIVAGIIAAMLILLFELQYPFRSNIGVSSHDWEGVLEHIDLMQSGSQMDMRM